MHAMPWFSRNSCPAWHRRFKIQRFSVISPAIDAKFVGDEWEEMRAIFYQSMHVVEDALSARREYLTKDGQIILGGPDHYARLAATKHYRDFLMASRPALKQPEEKDKRLTLPELEAMLRANKELPDPAHAD
jgi:hypothetical protein